MARWRADGAVEYLGRSDHQVKLRGLRIELGEIEAALRELHGMERVEVLLRRDAPGDARLVAYVPSALADPVMLRSHLATRVPDYMVPSAFVGVDYWPVTANGKLDRNALPKPPQLEVAGLAPRTPLEEELALLFAQALGREAPVVVDADFFSLGGDSLSAVHLLLAIEQRWRCDLGLGALFAQPTVAALAVRIAEPPALADHALGPVIALAATEAAGSTPLFVLHPAGGIAGTTAPWPGTATSPPGVWPAVAGTGRAAATAEQHRGDGQRLRTARGRTTAEGAGASAGLVGGRHPGPGDGGAAA